MEVESDTSCFLRGAFLVFLDPRDSLSLSYWWLQVSTNASLTPTQRWDLFLTSQYCKWVYAVAKDRKKLNFANHPKTMGILCVDRAAVSVATYIWWNAQSLGWKESMFLWEKRYKQHVLLNTLPSSTSNCPQHQHVEFGLQSTNVSVTIQMLVWRTKDTSLNLYMVVVGTKN